MLVGFICRPFFFSSIAKENTGHVSPRHVTNINLKQLPRERMQSALFELVLKYFFRTVSLSVLITKFPGGTAAPPGSLGLGYSSWQQLEISWTQRLESQEGQSLDTESGGIFSLVGSLWWEVWAFIMCPWYKWQPGGKLTGGVKTSTGLSLDNGKLPK